MEVTKRKHQYTPPHKKHPARYAPINTLRYYPSPSQSPRLACCPQQFPPSRTGIPPRLQAEAHLIPYGHLRSAYGGSTTTVPAIMVGVMFKNISTQGSIGACVLCGVFSYIWVKLDDKEREKAGIGSVSSKKAVGTTKITYKNEEQQ
jgi:hypothetical protein